MCVTYCTLSVLLSMFLYLMLSMCYLMYTQCVVEYVLVYVVEYVLLSTRMSLNLLLNMFYLLYTKCVAEYVLVSVGPASRHLDDLPLHRLPASQQVLSDEAETCLDVSCLKLNEV